MWKFLWKAWFNPSPFGDHLNPKPAFRRGLFHASAHLQVVIGTFAVTQMEIRMQRYIVRKLGSHRGSPRVYLDIDVMLVTGFLPGKTYSRTVDPEKKRLTLTAEANGAYVVCKKEKGGKELPVIDINSSEALGMFEGLEAIRIIFEAGRIHILPIASEMKRVDRLKRLATNMDAGVIKTAGFSFGGGVLDHAAHCGLNEAGLGSTLAMANEIDESLLDHAGQHNDIWRSETVGIAAPMQELVQDEAAMQRLPHVDIFCGGIPCSGASQAGKSKRGLVMMENHPDVGHLIASAIMLINRMNPAVVVIENVVPYSETASAQILRQHLRDSGYDVQETVLSAHDYGCMENRLRWFLVASSRGIDINLESLAPSVREVKKLSSVLENIGPDAYDWRTFDYLKTKELRDEAKGNSFAMQVVTPDSSTCPVLRKGYAKGGSTDPLLAHPTNPDLLRQLTVTEHARIKEVPEHLVAGMSKTDGHILLGQGIAYAPVRALFKRIGQCLMQWKDSVSGEIQNSNMATGLLRAVG